MMKRLTIVLLMLCSVKGVYAQSTNGLEFGLNYNWLNQTEPGIEYSPELGYQLGYRFDWAIAPKWRIGIRPSLNLNYVTGTYGTTLNADVDKLFVYYAALPVFVSREVFHKLSAKLGYQYGYLIDQEMTETNHHDHALLGGLSYDVGFCQLQLLYQHSLNAETYNSISYGTDENGQVLDVTKESKTRSKLSNFQFLIYIPLTKRK